MSHEATTEMSPASRKRRWPIVVGIVALIVVAQAIRAYVHVQEHGFTWPKWETEQIHHDDSDPATVMENACSNLPASDLTDAELRARIAAKFAGNCPPQPNPALKLNATTNR